MNTSVHIRVYIYIHTANRQKTEKLNPNKIVMNYYVSIFFVRTSIYILTYLRVSWCLHTYIPTTNNQQPTTTTTTTPAAATTAAAAVIATTTALVASPMCQALQYMCIYNVYDVCVSIPTISKYQARQPSTPSTSR